MAPATAFFDYLIRLGDDHLVLAQNLTKWCGHAPTLEEDIALSNMGLDVLGQARELLSYAGEIENKGRSEDDLAFLRLQHEYKNLLLVEQDNGDFAQTILRQFLFAAFMVPFWQNMEKCKDETLSAIATKAEKEMRYHIRHCGEWIIRLAQGTDESNQRITRAMQLIYVYTGEMFEKDDVVIRLIKSHKIPDPAVLTPSWQKTLKDIAKRSGLEIPVGDTVEGMMQSGGRTGHHTEYLGVLLSDLQYMQRSYPHMSW